MLVLLLRRQPAANMAFCLVDVQNHPRLRREGGIDVDETVGDVFMYRTLADSKLFRRLPHRRVFINNIVRYLDRPFFNIFFHGVPPEYLFLHHIPGEKNIFLPLSNT